MRNINWWRVILGGLSAGTALLAVQFVFHFALTGFNWWFFLALAHPIDEIAGIGRYVGLYLLQGFAVIWLYAATRPQFGPGPLTAAMIGCAYWIIGSALPFVSLAPLISTEFGPLFSGGWLISHAVALFGLVSAALVGGWLYCESSQEKI